MSAFDKMVLNAYLTKYNINLVYTNNKFYLTNKKGYEQVLILLFKTFQLL